MKNKIKIILKISFMSATWLRYLWRASDPLELELQALEGHCVVLGIKACLCSNSERYLAFYIYSIV